MKGIYVIFFSYFLLLVACSDSSKKSESNIIAISNDSISAYLKYANVDSFSIQRRSHYNMAAFNLLKKGRNDSINRINLFKVANRFYNLADFENYKNASRFVLDQSLESNDTAQIANSYSYLGDYYHRRLLKDSAFYYYAKSEKIYKLLQDNANLANINLSKATILWLQSDFFGSESATLVALKYLRYSPNDRKTFEAYTLLGLISKELYNYDKAIEYQNRALDIAKLKLSDDFDRPIAISYNNIGSIYQSLGNQNKAKRNFEEALGDKKLKIYNAKVYAVILDNLAYSKFKLNKSDPTIPILFTNALSIYDSINEKSLAIFSKVRFAEYYLSKGDTVNGIKITSEALNAARQIKNAGDMLVPLKQLATLIPEKASSYSHEYIKITDSLREAERKSKDKFARIQFETEEISLQKDKLEEQNRNLLLFFVGTVMIGLLLFVIRTQRAKNRELLHKQAQQKANEDIYNLMLSQQNKIEEGRIQEKKRIAQELHDGVLGRLFGARLNLDSLNKQDGELAEEKRNNYLSELKNIEQDIREISHDLNREKFVLINNFIAILNNLLEEQSASFGAEVAVNIDQRIKWEMISNALKINLYRIVQEALQNINKYANATKIEISLRQHEGNIHLNIIDNGVGFAVDRKSKGIGLQNMVSRVSECEGVFDINSKKGKGTTISIEFPIENKPITA